MPPEKLFISWQEFDTAVYSMAEQIINNGEEPDYVVGINRGGLPGAVMLSHAMEVDLATVDANHYEGMEQQQSVTTGTVDIPSDADALIFDDIVDSGETMREVEELVRTATGGIVRTAAIHIKPGRAMTPDYWLRNTDEWVVYPWEVSLQAGKDQ